MLHRSRPDLIKGIATRSQDGLPSTSSQSYTDVSGLSQSTSENSLNSSGSVDSQPSDNKSVRSDRSSATTVQPVGRKQVAKPRSVAGKSSEPPKPPTSRKSSVGDASGSSTPTQVAKPPTKKKDKRSEIVAAVTTRLYATKKKPDPRLEALQAADKDYDDDDGELEELKLCKRARMKLFDLSRKLAMTKRVRKTVDSDTQTEFIAGTIRLKEKCVITDQRGIIRFENSSTNTPIDKGLKDDKEPPVIMNQVFIPRSSNYVVECGKGVRVEVPGSPVKRDLGTQTMAERKTFKHQNTSPIKRIEDDEFSDDSLDLDQEDLEPKIGYLYRNRGVKYRSNDNLYREILYIDKPLFKQVIDNNLYRSFDSLLDKQPYRVEKSTLPISRYPICGTNVLYEYDPNKSIPDKIIYSNLGTQAVEPPCPRKPEVQVTLFNGLPLAICSESSNENVSVSVMSANLLSPNLRTDDNSSSDNSFLSNDGSEITSASETSSEDFVFYENPKEKGARELYTISENSEQSDKISSDNSSVQDTAFDAGAACRLEFTQPFTWERTEDVIYFEEPLLKTSQGDFEGRETSGVAENVAESVKGVEAEEPSREGDEKIPERVKLSEIFQNVMKVNVKNPEIDEGRMKTELPEGAVRFEVPEKLNPEAEETIPGKVKLSEIFQNVKKVDVKASGAKNSGTEEAIIEGIEELELPEGAVKAETAEPEKMKLSDIFQNVKRTDLAPDTKNRKPSEGAMKLELPEGVELYVPENVKEIIESLKKVGIIESFKPEETSELVKKSPGEVPEPVKIPESDQASRAKPKGVPKSLETNPKSVPKIKISQAEASTKPKTPEVVITLGSPEKLRCNVKNFSCKKVNWSEMQPNAQRQYLNFNILNSSRQAPFSIDTHLFGESSKKQNSEAAFPSEDSITFVFMGPSKQNSSVLMEIIKRSLGQATERKSRNRGVQCNSKLMRSVSVDTAMFALSRFARNQTPAGDMNRTTSLDMLASEDVQTILEQGRLHNVKENSCQCDLEETLQQIQKPKCTCKVLKYATGTTTTKDQETETIQERHEITTQTNKLDVMTTSESQTLFDAESVHVPAPPCPETPAAAKPDKRNRWKELKEIILGTECEIDVPEISTSSFRLGCYPEINRYGREDAAEQPLSLDSSSQTRRVRFSEPKRWSLADIAQIVQKKDATQTSMSAFLKEATLLLKNLNEVSKTPPDVQSPKKVQKRAENSVQTEKETNPKSPRRFDLTWPRRRATGKPPAGSKFLRSPVRPHSNPMAFPDVVKSQLESRISSCSTNWNISNLSTSFSNSYVGDVCSRPSSARSDYSNDSYYRYKPVRLPFNVSELEESCKRLEFAIERDRIRHRNLENRMSYFDVPKYVPRSLDLYEKPEPEVKEPISLNESRKTSQKSSNFRSCKCYCHRLTGFNRVKTSCFELESLNGKSKHCHVCCVPCQEEKPKRYYSAPVLNSCDLDCSRCHLCYNYCSCPSVRLKHVRTSPKAYMQHLLTVRRQIVDASKFTNIR